jgi:chaperonin GroEL
MPVLDVVMRDPRPLIVLAEKVDGNALGLLVKNTRHGTIDAVAVRAPGFGHRRIQHLGDLAAFTGGEVIAGEAGLTLQNVRRESLGRARRVVVTADSTVFIEGGGTHEAVAGRLAQIRAELGRASQERDVEVLQERLAKLALSLAVIRVGGATEVVLRERLRRTEGALAATQAALAEGIVPGGGTALLRCARALDALPGDGDFGRGVEVVRGVLSEPLFWIATNAGHDGQATVDQVSAMPETHGLDALSGEFGDLFEKGVVDPVRVTRLALEHAASVAALLLTTEALVAEEQIAQPGAIVAPGFGDLAEGLARPSSPI